MIRFFTESGSTYEIDDRDDSAWTVRRVLATHELRGDGDWFVLLNKPHVAVGRSVPLIMPVLNPPQFEGAKVTSRVTSPVTRVEVI